MRGIVDAPTIPVVSYMQPIRNWAASLLHRWALRPEAEALHPSEKARLELDTPPAALPQLSNHESYSTPKILYRIGEIAHDFQELRDALTEASDHSRIFRALDKIETWEADVEPLSVRLALALSARF